MKLRQFMRNTFRFWSYLSATSLCLLLLPLISVYPQTPPGSVGKVPEATSVQVPQTAEEHLKMAETYKQKAAEYRKVVKEHQEMLQAYRKRVPNDPRQPFENAFVKKMRLHCEKYIHESEALARDAEKFAEYHTMRAKELQGQ